MITFIPFYLVLTVVFAIVFTAAFMKHEEKLRSELRDEDKAYALFMGGICGIIFPVTAMATLVYFAALKVKKTFLDNEE